MKYSVSYIYTRMLSLMTFICIMNITFLNRVFHISSSITLGLRLIMSLLLFMVIVSRKKISAIFRMICLWLILILISTVINHDEVLYFVSVQSRTFLVCVLLEYYHIYPKKFFIFLSTWKDILLLLCIVDIATIIMFPNGLYQGDMYTSVWLLGYKTARLVYNIPLAILTCYLSVKQHNKIRTQDLFIVGCCAVSSFMVDATGASVAILLFVVIIFVTAVWGEKSFIKAFLKKIFNYRIVAIAYAALTVITVLGGSLVIYVSKEILGKSATLSHRTEIWARCLQFIADKPVLGMGYLTTEQYTQTVTLIRLGTNAHNMILSILMTVGVLGMIMYYIIFSYSWKSLEGRMNRTNVVLIAGSITYFLVGLSSSALVFSPFVFVPWVLMCYEKPSICSCGVKELI